MKNHPTFTPPGAMLEAARGGPASHNGSYGKSKKFPVPETMSVNFCWPYPMGEWYMMRFEDSKLLDHLHRMEGGKGTPTHPEKLALIKKHGWLTQKIGGFMHVASP